MSSLLPSVRVRHQDPYHFDSRECKMRIVERLGTVGSALQSEVAAGSQHLKGTNRATSTDQLIYPDSGTIQNPHTTIEGCKLIVKDDVEKSKDRGVECRESVSPVPAFQWLDDAQLGVLTTAELEEVMDRYLISVVQQLVQVSEHCIICIETALAAATFIVLLYTALYFIVLHQAITYLCCAILCDISLFQSDRMYTRNEVHYDRS